MQRGLVERFLVDVCAILVDAIELAIAEGLFHLYKEEELLLLLRRIVQILCFL